MTACEKCWGDAYIRHCLNPQKSQAEYYRELLEERKDNPCPTECPHCGNYYEGEFHMCRDTQEADQ